MMEYRFSLTARLAVLGAVALVALLVLLFALGYEAGHQGAGGARPAPAPLVLAAAAQTGAPCAAVDADANGAVP